MNDWLKQEFKQRVSRQRKIILTNQLSYAFQLVKIPVTTEMIEEEKSIINWNYNPFLSKELQKSLSSLYERLEFLKSDDRLEMWSKKLQEYGIEDDK